MCSNTEAQCTCSPALRLRAVSRVEGSKEVGTRGANETRDSRHETRGVLRGSAPHWGATLVLVVAQVVLAAEPVCPKTAKDSLLDIGPCDKKPVEACVVAGDKLIATPGCRGEALARYETACKRGALHGCAKQAFRMVENSHDPRVVAQAIALFTKACDGNDA